MEEYRISELFDIIPGKGVTNQEYVKGTVPYISESATINGIRFFINTTQILKNLTIVNKSLSISSKTGKVFYHKNNVAIGQQTHALKLKSKYPQTENVYLYLAAVIERQTLIKASFGYQLSEERLPFVKILIPSENKKPKWDEMAKTIETIKLSYKKIEFDSSSMIDNVEENVNWKPFELSVIFKDTELYSCVSTDENKIAKNAFINGTIPYVTRTSNNNAIKTFLNGNINIYKEPGNCITIGLDTQTINYQPYEFSTGQNIIIIRKKGLNKYVYLFLATIIGNAMSKFSWGSNGATLTRLGRLKIMLPERDGSPDWKYMEDYIKNMRFSKMI